MESVRRELKPRDLGDLVNETFSTYGRNFLKLITIAAIVAVPLAVVSYVFGEVFTIEEPPGDNWDDVAEYLIVVGQLSLAMMVVSVIMYPLMAGALIYGTCEQHLRQPIDVGRAYSFAWKRLVNLIGAALLVMIAVFFLAITCIGFPFAIYFAVKWTFASPAIVVEGHGPIEAMSRSAGLVTGSWWRVFGIGLVFIIMMFVAQLVIGIPISFIATGVGGEADDVIQAIGSGIGSILIFPFMWIGITLLYYDLRLRREEFNIDIMSEEMGLESGGADKRGPIY